MTQDYLAWDYSQLASHYQARPDYALEAIDHVLQDIPAASTVVEVGAGTGKLTRPLAHYPLTILATEPNHAMRQEGVKGTPGTRVTWLAAKGEALPFAAKQASLVAFGSSFNVVDSLPALREASRVLQPSGKLACLWNHRKLDDPLQARIEALIHQFIPDYQYGSRRSDQTERLQFGSFFHKISCQEFTVQHTLSRENFLQAWRAHATLTRQTSPIVFGKILQGIQNLVAQCSQISVPYTTVVWTAYKCS